MLELLWDIDTLKRLSEKGRALLTDIAALVDIAQQSEADQARRNLPQKLLGIRHRLQEIVKGVYRFRRIPASHVFVSSELRNKKPYAVPLQCLPYAGLKEADMRRILKLVVQEMVKHGMKVAGKCAVMIFTIRLCNESRIHVLSLCCRSVQMYVTSTAGSKLRLF